MRVFQQPTIGMGMYINKAWRNNQPRCVDGLIGNRTRQVTNGPNPIPLNANISVKAGEITAVNNRPIPNNRIKHIVEYLIYR